MRLMIDILHPAHVQFFRHFIQEMEREGHELLITARNKDITIDLLKEYEIPHTQISVVRKGALGRVYEFLERGIRFYRLARKFKPDLVMSEQGVTTAPVGKLLGVPSLIFWDTEVSKITNTVCYPLATAVYTPESYRGSVRGNHQRYKGYQKLAYLHPDRFTANPTIREKYNLPGKYCIIRIVSLTSNHDKNEHGFNDLVSFIQKLEKIIPIFITSEEPLPEELKPYCLRSKYSDFYDILSSASLYVGESATVATEAALLGVPSVYVGSSERGYINELQERYGMVYWCTDDEDAAQKSEQILADPQSKEAWQEKRDAMMTETVDLTSLMVDLAHSYDTTKKE